MIYRCIRCGNWVRRESGVQLFGLNRGETWQHRRCHDRYKGTDVHFVHNPDPAAAGEAFTADDGAGNFTIYDVASILEHLCIEPRRPYIVAQLPLEVSKSIMEKNEVNPDDAMAIAEARRAEGSLDMPVILVQNDDLTNFPIDGSHRIAYAYLIGQTTINAWVLGKSETDGYRIDNWNPALSDFFAIR